ncbi:MAG: acyl-CoA dehydrogenase family protein [Pseudomonadota bacterium]
MTDDYTFAPFLEWRDRVDWYADDPFLQRVLRHFAGDDWEAVDAAARGISPMVSGRWGRLAEEAARPEKRPSVLHYDGHGNRIDRIQRPLETWILEAEIFSLGLFSRSTPMWSRLVQLLLIYQNGEACIACPLVCTEGLIALLERFADRDETRAILEHCREGRDGGFAIGAQYLSEIQGGSDVPANIVEAVPDGDAWRLYGPKFFCSATHADYAVVTARPRGSDEIGLFVMPSWVDPDREQRNGFTVDRIKWKMGTSELTTAEITLDGARAYQVGPLDRGVANVTGIVLTTSRLTVGLSSAANMLRAVREARAYAEFREAFGQPIARYPLVTGQLRRIEHRARATLVGAFSVYRDFLRLPDGFRGGLSTDEPDDVRRLRFRVRELVMLQKIVASLDSTDVLRTAMSIFGGHGIMEDFSALPRLYRDSAINELWEGPRNVLLTQIHRDLQRVASWYPTDAFVRDVLAGAPEAVVGPLARETAALVAHPSLLTPDEDTIAVADRWDRLADALMHTVQDNALREVEDQRHF